MGAFMGRSLRVKFPSAGKLKITSIIFLGSVVDQSKLGSCWRRSAGIRQIIFVQLC